jgi:DNA topoisomerase-1
MKRIIRQIEATDGGAALQVLEGRYGPYVTDGETNASIPRGTDPASISLEDARELLEARRNAAPAPGRRRRGAPVRKRRPARAAAASPEPTARPASAGRPRAKRKPARRKPAGNKIVH